MEDVLTLAEIVDKYISAKSPLTTDELEAFPDTTVKGISCTLPAVVALPLTLPVTVVKLMLASDPVTLTDEATLPTTAERLIEDILPEVEATPDAVPLILLQLTGETLPEALAPLLEEALPSTAARFIVDKAPEEDAPPEPLALTFPRDMPDILPLADELEDTLADTAVRVTLERLPEGVVALPEALLEGDVRETEGRAEDALAPPVELPVINVREMVGSTQLIFTSLLAAPTTTPNCTLDTLPDATTPPAACTANRRDIYLTPKNIYTGYCKQ